MSGAKGYGFITLNLASLGKITSRILWGIPDLVQTWIRKILELN